MRIRLLSLLLLISTLAVGQNRELDSLYAELEKHRHEDTIRLKLMFSICYLESTVHPEKSKELAEHGLRISKDIHYPKGEGSANRYLALFYNGIGDLGQATKHAYEMLKIYESLKYEKGIGQANQLLGIIYESDHNFDKSKSFYTNALEIYKKLDLKRDIGYGYNSLGSLHVTFMKYDEGLDYFLNSLKVREEIKDERGLFQIYQNIAFVYTQQKKFPEALEYFKRTLSLTKSVTNINGLAILYLNMGNLYTMQGNYALAETNLLKSDSLAKTLRDMRILEDVYAKLAILEKRRGRLAEALQYTETQFLYKDSVHTADNARQIAEMETRYQSQKKDQRIQLLERDEKIHSLWQNIFIIALIFVTILSFGFYFLQRYRENKNREILNLQIDVLTSQNEELSTKYRNSIIETHEKKPVIDSRDQRLLKTAIGIVEENIADPKFNVESLAQQLGMSRSSMHRNIKTITGLPPSELIRSIRLRKAATLLKSKADLVSQIGFLVGFEDHSYFSKSFKKQYGVPPSEYVSSLEKLKV